MSAWKQKKKLLSFVLVLVVLFASVPALVVSASAASGSVYYNGLKYPAYDFTAGKYYYLISYDANSPWLYECSKPLKYGRIGSTDGFVSSDGKALTVTYYKLDANGAAWIYHAGESWNSCYSVPGYVMLWASVDVSDGINGGVYMGGSVPALDNGQVEGLDVSRSPNVCYTGSCVYLTISVNGTGDYDKTVSCTLSGALSSDTYIGHDVNDINPNIYYLEVGEDETASHVLITVVSNGDPSKTAVHQIDIIQSGGSGGTAPSTPEGEEPIPTEENPTEPEDSEKDEAVGEGDSSVDDLTEVIPDYSEGFLQALQDFAGAMSYTGTEAKLKIPAVMFPQLGNLVPGFQMMDELELDFEMYVGMMPDNLMTLVRALFTVALIVYCFKEFYGLIAYALTLKGGVS